MLSNERYDQTRRACPISVPKPPPYNQEGSDLLVAEDYQTKEALKELGVTDSKTHQPGNLPQINSLISPEKPIARLEPNLVISIAGMPKAGKTKTIKTYRKRHPFRSHFIEESYPVTYQRGLTTFDPVWATELFKRGLDSEIFFYFNMMDRGKLPKRPILRERGTLDRIPFERSLLLTGQLSSMPKHHFATAEVIDLWTLTREFSLVFVLCLVPPVDSTARGSKFTPEYLTTLYEQYLRFHYEITNYKRLFNRPLPITYACLDFTGSSKDNYRIWSRITREILG